MRTTLDLDPDVLQAAKELAEKERSTAGKVISRVFRRGLRAPEATEKAKVKYTFKNLLALAAHHKGRLVTFDETIVLSAVPLASHENLCVT